MVHVLPHISWPPRVPDRNILSQRPETSRLRREEKTEEFNHRGSACPPE
jgi:hypothetical protein